MEQEIKIEDHSGDKKYFSQIPHYILNHSTANDQALYLQMKRYSGETGKCFATQETLSKKLGIGTKAFNKSLKYLLDKKWIKFIGKTQGKTRPINTYAIVDIWKLNILHYEEIVAERTVSFKKDTCPKEKDTCPKNSKILVESGGIRRTVKEEHNKNIELQSSSGKEINDLIDLFKKVNPSYDRLFRNKTQRSALLRLLQKHGPEKIEWVLKVLPKTNGLKFSPTITTPIQLEDKLGSLIAFIKKEENNFNQNKIKTL